MTWDGELVWWFQGGLRRKRGGFWGCVEEERAKGGLSPDAFEMGQCVLVESRLFQPSESGRLGQWKGRTEAVVGVL